MDKNDVGFFRRIIRTPQSREMAIVRGQAEGAIIAGVLLILLGKVFA